MVVISYDSRISKVLPIDVEIPKQGVSTNYYPHYVMGKSTKIAEKVWNNKQLTMNYYVYDESDNRECGYPEIVGVRFRIYQEGQYVASCNVKYNCDTGIIIFFETKILKDTTTVQATDIEQFIKQIINIFGILALYELLKRRKNRKKPAQPGGFTPTIRIGDSNGSSEGNTENSTKQPEKKYVESSWQKHGYYKKDRTYVKSSICQRNPKLFTT